MTRSAWVKSAIGALIIAAALAAILLTDLRQYVVTAPGRHAAQLLLRSWLHQAGFLGPVFFVIIYGLGCLFFLPASIFTGLGALLYGKFWGIPMNLLGAIFGGAIAFLGARYLFRDLAQRLVGQRLASWNEKLSKNGIWVVMWLRLCLLPYPVVNLGAALTRINFRDYMVGTILGIALPLAYISYTLGSLSELAFEERSFAQFLRDDLWILLLGLVFYLSLPQLIKRITKQNV